MTQSAFWSSFILHRMLSRSVVRRRAQRNSPSRSDVAIRARERPRFALSQQHPRQQQANANERRRRFRKCKWRTVAERSDFLRWKSFRPKVSIARCISGKFLCQVRNKVSRRNGTVKYAGLVAASGKKTRDRDALVLAPVLEQTVFSFLRRAQS